MYLLFNLIVAIFALIPVSESAFIRKGNENVKLLAKESDDEKKQRFAKFKGDNGKSYKDSTEENAKYQVFVGNLELIDQRNLLEGKMVHDVTRFSDLTQEEFEARYLTRQSSFQASAAELSEIAHDSPFNHDSKDVKLEAVDVDWSGNLSSIFYSGYCEKLFSTNPLIIFLIP